MVSALLLPTAPRAGGGTDLSAVTIAGAQGDVRARGSSVTRDESKERQAARPRRGRGGGGGGGGAADDDALLGGGGARSDDPRHAANGLSA